MATIGEQKRMTVIDHLTELRRRIVVSVVAVALGMVVAFVEKDWVFGIIKRPLLRMKGVNTDLVTFSPTEPFMTVLKVSIYAGMLLALPIVLWQIWAFIMPALYERERKSVLPYVFFTTALFVGGVAFAYYAVLPVGLGFLVGYGGDIFLQQLRASEYIGFVSMFLLAFGVVFEMPAMMLLLTSAGIVDHHMLKRVRKYAVVGIAVAAMVLTPSQDPVSMLLMMGPLLALYEIGILLSRASGRKRTARP
ncbi:MAG TPA: twin-arginine translocase subunit TatC [Thermoleophilia bacterium]|nr:twin-arginine translocase subunit TatC [Thermoleophilia bacterium]